MIVLPITVVQLSLLNETNSNELNNFARVETVSTQRGTRCMKKICYLILVIIVLTVIGCSPQQASTPTPSPSPEPVATKAIVLGDIDEDDPISKIQEFQPIADYLAENLTDFGITKGEVKIS